MELQHNENPSQQPSSNNDPSSHSIITTQRQRNSSKLSKSHMYQFDWFPMTTSPWIASIAFIFQIMYPVHLIDFYGDSNIRVFNLTSQNSSFRLISPFIIDGIESVSYSLNSIISILCIITLLFNKNQEEQEGYKYILAWIGGKLFPLLRYMIDINLAIAAIFLIKTPLVSVFFILAAIINLLISFFCQNYTLRKDYLCCKSMQYMMMWRICIILGYSVSCAGYYLVQTSKVALIIFIILQFVISLTLLVCYFLFGYLIYRHTSSQLVMLILLNIFFSISAGNLYDFALAMASGNFVANRNLVLSATSFVFIGVMMYGIWTNIKKKGSQIHNKDPIQKIYFLFNKLENSSQNINDDCEIRGIIRYHLSHSCKNPNCFINQPVQQYYDSKKNKYCSSSKINQGKTSFVKFIAKCIYEQELDNIKWDNTNLLLDYIEFYYLKLKNIFRATHLLVELEKKFLTPFQRIRLTRLRRVMLEQNSKLNQQLFHGSLDFQNLIVSQNKFDEIQQQLKQVLRKNIQFWKYIENYSINLSSLIKIIRPNFALIEKINGNWKMIAKYFQIQRVWKFVYICYTLYFRNQKLKPQHVQEFGQSVHQDQIFSYQSLHIDKNGESNKLYASKIIFEQDTCCIHINDNQQKSVIKTVSRYFQRIFGYQNNEIIQSSLDTMLIPCFKQFHHRKFMKWAGEGMSNKQNNYEVKKVFPINKNGFIISTFKFYKQFLCMNQQLQYVAMFKKNKQEQMIFILNQNYQIQGMTQSLAQRLNMSNDQYKQMIGLNLLIFLPGLIEYTKFQQQKQNIMDSLLGALQIDHRNTVTYDYSQKSKTKRTAINSKKQFTKNNMQLSIPYSLQKIRQSYIQKQRGNDTVSNTMTNNFLSKSNILTRILKNCSQLKEMTQKRKYKVQIQVRMIQVQQSCYFQFYIRQIQSSQKNNDNKPMQNSMKLTKRLAESYQNEQIQDMSRFFENSHNSQNISLAFNDNIFIKQDNNQPVQMIQYANSISVYVRIVFVLFFGLLIGSLLFQYNNYDNYKLNSEKTFAMVQLQLQLFMLDNMYHSNILNISGTQLNIQELTQNIRQIRQKDIQFKKSILDSSINVPQNYSIVEQNKKIVYNHIDITDRVFETIIQIMYQHNGNPYGTQAYSIFQQAMIPSMEVLTTNAIDNISQIFDQIYQRIEIKNYGYIAIGCLLLIVAFLLVLSQLFKISKSFISLMEIFTQFNQTDLKKIIRYSSNLKQLFYRLTDKYDFLKQNQWNIKQTINQARETEFNNFSNGSSSMKGTNVLMDEVIQDENVEHDSANLNKKVKKVQNGRQLNNLKFRSTIYLVIFLVLYGMSQFGLNLYTSIINKQIINFKNAGHEIFQYYSSINVYYLSMKDRQILGNQYNASRYTSYFTKISEMKKMKYEQGSSLYQDFVTLRNLLIFGNVCQNYPQVVTNVGYSLQQCMDIAQNNMQHGIQSYMFYMTSNVDYFQTSNSLSIDPTLASNLDQGMEMSNLYLQYLLQQWSHYFVNMMSASQRNIIIICSSLFVVQVIIYIVLIQVLIVGNLKEKFEFFKKVYNNMMPDFIITKQKIIKAKLQVEGFIQK